MDKNTFYLCRFYKCKIFFTNSTIRTFFLTKFLTMLFFGNNVFLNYIIELVISNLNKNIYFTWSAEREKSNTSIWWNCFFFLFTHTQYLLILKIEYLFLRSLWPILQIAFTFSKIGVELKKKKNGSKSLTFATKRELI